MISTKGRYALRVMIDLAEHADEGFIPLKDVADRQEISKKYLEILVKTLVGARLLEGASGKGGGYRLTRTPADYTVLEILELMEGTLAPVNCLAAHTDMCARSANCRTLPMWKEFDELVHHFFSVRTLEDLMDTQNR